MNRFYTQQLKIQLKASLKSCTTVRFLLCCEKMTQVKPGV